MKTKPEPLRVLVPSDDDWPEFAPAFAQRAELRALPMEGARELVFERTWTVPTPNERYDGDGDDNDFPIMRVLKTFDRRNDLSSWVPTPAEILIIENPPWARTPADLVTMLREVADVIEADSESQS